MRLTRNGPIFLIRGSLKVIAVWCFFYRIFRKTFRLFEITVFLFNERLFTDRVEFKVRASELADFDRFGHDGRQKAPVVLIAFIDAAAIRKSGSLSGFFGSSA